MMEEKDIRQLSLRQMRQHVFSLVYNLGFYDDQEFADVAQRYVSSQDIEDAGQRSLIQDKALAVMGRRQEIDAMVDAQSAHWKTKRIAKVDLAIIRLAVYEMLDDPDVPVGVAINEAVRLAKKFSSEQAPAFVNGVLAGMVPRQTGEESCPQP